MKKIIKRAMSLALAAVLSCGFIASIGTKDAQAAELTKTMYIMVADTMTEFQAKGFAVNTFGGITCNDCEQVEFGTVSSAWNDGDTANTTKVYLPKESELLAGDEDFADLEDSGMKLYEVNVTIDADNLESWVGIQFVLYNDTEAKALQTVNGDEAFISLLKDDTTEFISLPIFMEEPDANGGLLYVFNENTIDTVLKDLNLEDLGFDFSDLDEDIDLDELIKDVADDVKDAPTPAEKKDDVIAVEDEKTPTDVKPVAETANDESPETADAAQIFLFATLALISLAGISLVVVKKVRA